MHDHQSDALVTFTIGEDVKAGDCLKIDFASGEVVLARSESYDLVALANYTKDQLVAVPFEFKPNTSTQRNVWDIRFPLSALSGVRELSGVLHVGRTRGGRPVG